jgi:hypothetical protein
MAAIAFTVKGQCVKLFIPFDDIYTAMALYHAPHTKNSRNIISDS